MLTATDSATSRSARLPRDRKAAYLSGFCNIWQHSEKGVGGLWL
jgi:hypothetical protein